MRRKFWRKKSKELNVAQKPVIETPPVVSTVGVEELELLTESKSQGYKSSSRLEDPYILAQMSAEERRKILLGQAQVSGRKLYDTPASFIISKDGSYTVSYNCKTGKITRGTDASAVIQAALDALTSGGKIFIKAGTYTISNSIIINSFWSGALSIEGEGWNTLLKLDNNVNDSMFKGDGRWRLSLSNFRMDGNKANNTGEFYGVGFDKLQDARLTNLDIRNFERGVDAPSGLMSLFNNLFIQGNRHIGIRLRMPDFIITNSYIGSNGIDASLSNHYSETGYSSGITIVNSEDGVIANNHIWGGFSGIFSFFSRVRIVSNVIEDHQREGIRGQGSVRGTIITSNVIEHNSKESTGSYDAILFQIQSGGRLINTVVESNTFRGTDTIKHRNCIREEFLSGATAIQDNLYINNGMANNSFTTDAIVLATAFPSLSKVRNNQGWVTENSGTSTGTGSQQTIAHGCDFTPTKAQVMVTNIDDGANPYLSANPDATNIYVTAVNGKDYRWEVKM